VGGGLGAGARGGGLSLLRHHLLGHGYRYEYSTSRTQNGGRPCHDVRGAGRDSRARAQVASARGGGGRQQGGEGGQGGGRGSRLGRIGRWSPLHTYLNTRAPFRLSLAAHSTALGFGMGSQSVSMVHRDMYR
jgi:hypothetical protein